LFHARACTIAVRRSFNLVRAPARLVHCTIITVYKYQNWDARAKKQAQAGKFGLACILLMDT
jgi:hypothetical protein